MRDCACARLTLDGLKKSMTPLGRESAHIFFSTSQEDRRIKSENGTRENVDDRRTDRSAIEAEISVGMRKKRSRKMDGKGAAPVAALL